MIDPSFEFFSLMGKPSRTPIFKSLFSNGFTYAHLSSLQPCKHIPQPGLNKKSGVKEGVEEERRIEKIEEKKRKNRNSCFLLTLDCLYILASNLMKKQLFCLHAFQIMSSILHPLHSLFYNSKHCYTFPVSNLLIYLIYPRQ